MAPTKQNQKDRRSYSTLIRILSSSHPILARHLRIAESNRQQRLARYLSSARLEGIEELLGHLEQMQQLFLEHHRLQRIAFLLEDSREAFVSATEATLSGYYSVAFDAMRTVMEVEFILRDFRYNTKHLEEWLACTRKQRLSKFRPAVLRARYATRRNTSPERLPESNDYAQHSSMLHVGPDQNPFGGVPGISEPVMPFGDDAAFWEIFEHGKRLLAQVHGVKGRLAPRLKAPLGPKSLPKFQKGWKQTQEMQFIAFTLAMAVLDASNQKNGDE